MICHNKNNFENETSNNPDIEHISLNHRLDLLTDLPEENVDLSNDIQDEEIDMEISIDDSSVIWDIRQLFDLDFLTRDVSPFPRGDSTDIPSEIMRNVTPVFGDGWAEENNLNIFKQSNQNNFGGDTKRSNTCLKNLTRAIHDSDQVKDILFGTLNKSKEPINTVSAIPPSKKYWLDDHDDGNTYNKIDLQRKEYVSDNKTIYRKPQRESSRGKSRRYEYEYSSSSESSSDSSCSCSSRRRKNRRRCHQKMCHCNQNLCQHGCSSIPQQNTTPSIPNNSNVTQDTNQYQCNMATNAVPLYNNYMMPAMPWPMSYMPPMEYNDLYSQQYAPIATNAESINRNSFDMSDIIERIHKLNISLDHLTKSTCSCQDLNHSPSQVMGNHYDEYCVNH